MPAVARLGDREATHCSAPFRAGHFKTVFANRIPMSGVGHQNTIHLVRQGRRCGRHTAALRGGSRSVFAEGIRIGRVGDPTCTRVIQGSPNVFSN